MSRHVLQQLRFLFPGSSPSPVVPSPCLALSSTVVSCYLSSSSTYAQPHSHPHAHAHPLLLSHTRNARVGFGLLLGALMPLHNGVSPSVVSISGIASQGARPIRLSGTCFGGGLGQHSPHFSDLLPFAASSFPRTLTNSHVNPAKRHIIFLICSIPSEIKYTLPSICLQGFLPQWRAPWRSK